MMEKKNKEKFTKEEIKTFNKVINTDKPITQKDARLLKSYFKKQRENQIIIEDKNFQKFYRKYTSDKEAFATSNVVDPKKKKVRLGPNKFKIISKKQNPFGAYQFIGLFEFTMRFKKRIFNDLIYGFTKLKIGDNNQNDLVREAYDNALSIFLSKLNITDGSGKYTDNLTVILVDYYYSSYITYEQTIYDIARKRSTL